MRDARVSPVKDPDHLITDIDVVHVQIVVLDRVRYARPSEIGAEPLEAGLEAAQPAYLGSVERQFLV